MYLELVGPADVRNNGLDDPSAIIEYTPGAAEDRPQSIGYVTVLMGGGAEGKSRQQHLL